MRKVRCFNPTNSWDLWLFIPIHMIPMGQYIIPNQVGFWPPTRNNHHLFTIRYPFGWSRLIWSWKNPENVQTHRHLESPTNISLISLFNLKNIWDSHSSAWATCSAPPLPARSSTPYHPAISRRGRNDASQVCMASLWSRVGLAQSGYFKKWMFYIVLHVYIYMISPFMSFKRYGLACPIVDDL
jgi:hypothetical protein